jgi:hypothetical protein
MSDECFLASFVVLLLSRRGGVVQQAQGLNHLDLVAEKLAGNLNSDVFSVLNPVS